MIKSLRLTTAILSAFLINSTALTAQQIGDGDGPPDFTPDPLPFSVQTDFPDRPTDDQTVLIVGAAEAFIGTLDDAQRAAVSFEFQDNAQRPNWSNLPDGLYKRAGVKRGDMSDTQLAALDDLLKALLSEEGFDNAHHQMAADGELTTGPFIYGPSSYYVNFLGTPSENQPWMVQFGGHHLAINATVYGSDVEFSPMLTGGEPLRITFEDEEFYIASNETRAAETFMQSLDPDQIAKAVISDERLEMLLGPGTFGTVLVPEGIRGSDLTEVQKALLLEVIGARVGFINSDDAKTVMDRASAELEDTIFGWWGPQEILGAAYFRISAPSLVMEYAPDVIGGGTDYTDHAHNSFRNPKNDYAVEWISTK